MFHSCQVLVLRMTSKTFLGGAAMRVLASTENVPPDPCVGTGIGGSNEDVTGEETEVVGSDVGG